jgi:metal transporter CNNM
MSIGLTIVAVIIFVGVSALASGLNIALMSLSLPELRRKTKLGNLMAKKVLPFRQNTHLTLAAILITNMAAASATSLMLAGIFFGVIAGAIATLLLVIFGEVLPQAFFSRGALRYCANLSLVMRGMIILTYPVSKPLQLLLDTLFSEQKAQLQTRRELGMMISEHLERDESELDDDEIEIIRGALQLSEKNVSHIMLPIADVFWLTPDTKLTPTRVAEIERRGRSRIPILNEAATQCYGLLLMKELVNVDFNTTLYKIADLPLHPVQLVGSRTALDTMLRKFITSSTHLVPVERRDKIVGIVTIEDLIEEIVGREIEDETDRRRKRSKLEV